MPVSQLESLPSPAPKGDSVPFPPQDVAVTTQVGPKGGLRDAAQALAASVRAPPFQATFAPTFVPLPAPATSAGNAECIAVDGSHAVLVDNGPLWVVAYRAAAIAWPGPALQAEPLVVATAPDEAQAVLDAAFAGAGLAPPSARSAESFAQALRSLAETGAALAAVATAAPGTLLLVDGALHGLPPQAQPMADTILAAARQRGVEAVGVSKRSALCLGGHPLSSLWAAGPATPWAIEVEPHVYAARLHARANHAFRIDAQSLDAVARLAPLCRDAAYPGYPYPLAVAHNMVALTASHARELKERLVAEVRQAGGPEAARMLADFHDVLDRNL